MLLPLHLNLGSAAVTPYAVVRLTAAVVTLSALSSESLKGPTLAGSVAASVTIASESLKGPTLNGSVAAGVTLASEVEDDE